MIQGAEDNGCDRILRVSHGRQGERGGLLGRETQKVLAHTTIPMFVCR